MLDGMMVCMRCRFLVQDGVKGEGICIRYPPTVMAFAGKIQGVTALQAVYPRVAGNNQCGEWSDKGESGVGGVVQ